jgi:hypothetical protein
MVASLSSSDTKPTILFRLMVTKSVVTYINLVPSFASDCLCGCGLCSLNWLIWICAMSASWTLNRLRNAARKSLRVRCAFVLAVHSAADSRYTGKASCLWCVDVAWPVWRATWVMSHSEKHSWSFILACKQFMGWIVRPAAHLHTRVVPHLRMRRPSIIRLSDVDILFPKCIHY